MQEPYVTKLGPHEYVQGDDTDTYCVIDPKAERSYPHMHLDGARYQLEQIADGTEGSIYLADTPGDGQYEKALAGQVVEL